MKKTSCIIFTLFFIVLLLSMFTIGKARVSVSPAEFSIILDENFIKANNSKNIIVTNYNDYNISVKAKMTHPDPLEWIRPNRTVIKNLSWITVWPSYFVIPSNTSADFIININIPEEQHQECLDECWESWAAFKIGSAPGSSSGPISEGYLVRVYVDAPETPKKDTSTGSDGDDEIIYDTVIALVVALVVILLYFKIRNRI